MEYGVAYKRRNKYRLDGTAIDQDSFVKAPHLVDTHFN
jgi:hypothetical protein